MPAAYDPQNIFAKVLRGEIPSHKVFEDDKCLAILDIFPVNPGHVLVIPKAAAVTVPELDPQLSAHLFAVAARLSKAVRAAAPKCEGVNFWISDGAAAGQEVPHVHLHIIPRFEGDGFGWRVGPNNRKPLAADALKASAEALRAAVAALPGER
jgi:diadenosine tetraphosphate (Ap4A) HIT family hydrolase